MEEIPDKNATISPEKEHPKTGSENIYVLIAIIGIVSVVLYFKNKKYNF